MPVINVKGVLCCEFSVRIDVNGDETVEEIKDTGKYVFEKCKDQIIENVLFDNPSPVGEFFKLTIAYDEKKFFIPKRSLSEISSVLDTLRSSDADVCKDNTDVYTPRFQL